jgi:hypothetical protein
MGYFANGTEGAIYEETYCRRCIHYGPEEGPGCPIWFAHLLHNYDLCNEDPDENPAKQMLDMFIPINTETLENEQCTMFALSEEGGVNESSSSGHGQQMSPLRRPGNARLGRTSARTSPPAEKATSCPRCDGDGYLESWNDDQSGVVIELCPDCGMADPFE